ncbi:MAG: SpoIIE family protein phosphatase [Flavobacteriales bacterium]|nr:SpoIIE family protein phosphatase [Flavobacteriales bacterium]
MNNSFPQKADIKWTAILLILNIIIQLYYSVEVCPYVEGQTTSQILTSLFAASVVAFGLKWGLHKPLFHANDERLLSRINIVKDTIMFALIGILIGTYNALFFEFPFVSGFKLIIGNLAVGFLSASVLFFARHIVFINSNIEISVERLRENQVKVAQGLLIFVLVTIGLGLSVLILLLVKDIRWLFENNFADLGMALREIGVEVSFVAVIFIAYFTAIILLFSRYLSNQINKQKKVLSEVSKGNLNASMGIFSNDEFGQIAHYTNTMIGQLKENKEVIHSIEYAKHLQDAVLPPDDYLASLNKDMFILFRPKDIVSGDFYWFAQCDIEDDCLFFAVADCTGHGVPGALVSMICNNALDRAVKEFFLKEPADILNKVREIVIAQFSKSQEMIQDGMDIALCRLKGNELVYSGANNPLWIVRNNKLLEWKADRQPVANYPNPKPFTSHTVTLQKGDSIYLFSDGFADQFGGANGKKFKQKNLKKSLISLEKKDALLKHQKLEQIFDNWMDGFDQIDDVCVLGMNL